MLNKSSPMTDIIPNTKLQLWDHQRRMVHRCMEIEKKSIYKAEIKPRNGDRYKVQEEVPRNAYVGVMNDPPGTGKTYTMLALLAMDAKKTLNVLVVPPNIQEQWVNAIKSLFTPGSFKWLSISSYSDTIQLWKTNKIFDGVRLVITSTLYIDPVSSALSSLERDYNKGTVIERIIIDEVDTAAELFYNIPSSNRIWLLSASFNHERHSYIGPFNMSHLKKDEIAECVCRCEDGLIGTCLQLESPKVQVIEVDDGEIALFLNGVLEDSDVVMLNALNFKKIKSKYSYLVSPDTVADCSLSEYAAKVLKSLEDERDFLMLMENELPESKINDIVLKIKTLHDNMDIGIKRGATKLDKIHEIATQSIKPNLSSKWIFFSDDDAILDTVGDILRKEDIVYTTMDNGTLESTEKSICKYKAEQSCQVLFMNSMRDGCGLNLENTTHIVFLHSINPHMLEQVIGRAQRPGRTCVLNIIYLYHKNETTIV